MNNVIAFLRFVVKNDEQWYCGYVGVKDDSMLPHSEQSLLFDEYMENDILDKYIDVHGGITFDGKFNKKCYIVPITDIPADWYEYHIYGFDLNHAGDDDIKCDYEYAKAEVLKMKEQMETLIVERTSSTGE